MKKLRKKSQQLRLSYGSILFFRGKHCKQVFTDNKIGQVHRKKDKFYCQLIRSRQVEVNESRLNYFYQSRNQLLAKWLVGRAASN